MQCERCGNESHNVLRVERCRTATGARHNHSDRRHYRCTECGQVSIVECRLTLIEVFDPETHAKRTVTVEEYRDRWRKVEHVTHRQYKMRFGDDDE